MCGWGASEFSSLVLGGEKLECCRWAEKANQSLDVLRHGCQEELLPHKLQSSQAQATQPNLILQFCKQRLHFLSLPLCLRKLRRVGQLPCALPRRFVLMNDQATECRTGALWSQRAGTAPFACPDVGPGMIAMTSTAIVQRLTRRAGIAVVFRFISETLGSEEWASLSVDTVARPHIGCNVPIRQPL